jgi:hypothetical protein
MRPLIAILCCGVALGLAGCSSQTPVAPNPPSAAPDPCEGVTHSYTDCPAHQEDPNWAVDSLILFEDNGIVCVLYPRAPGPIRSAEWRLRAQDVVPGSGYIVDDSLRGLWALNPLTGQRRRIMPQAWLAQYSPAAQRMAYCIGAYLSAFIYTARLDGSDLRQITSVGASFYPAWSPDGTQIVFDHNEGHGFDLWVMNADGSNQRMLLPKARMGDWSPDGRFVACVAKQWYTTNGLFGLVEVEVATGATRLIGQLDSLGVRSVPRYSPDGTKMLIEYECYGSWGPAHLLLVDRQSGATQLLTSEPGMAPTWSPDSSEIVFTQGSPHGRPDSTGTLWTLTLADGSVRPLLGRWPERCPPPAAVRAAGAGPSAWMHRLSTTYR